MSFDVNQIIMESLLELNENMGEIRKETSPVIIKSKPKIKPSEEDFLAKKAKELARPVPTPEPKTFTQEDLDAAKAEAEARGFDRGEFSATAKHAHTDVGKLKEKIEQLEAEKKTLKNAKLDQEDVAASQAMQKAADEEAAASAAKNARLDQEDVSASQAMQKAADEEARLAAERAARKAAGLDTSVDVHLRRAINRVGQALGIQKSAWDKEAAEAGLQTHLARAGRSAIEAFREKDPYAIGAGAGAASIAAGLGTLAMAKKLRGSKKGRARA